jgi:hypothetical protein
MIDNVLEDNAAIGAAPESTSNDAESFDFFGELESQVNGGIMENIGVSEEQQVTLPQADSVNDKQETPNADNENLQKRYSDSSREAKRLNTRLKEVEPYMPILDAMREDPRLVSHVRGYYEGGGQAPTSMKEQLKLGEDFTFDADEALSNPDSDSGKLFNATVDGMVQRRLQQVIQAQNVQSEKDSRDRSFKEKHNMNNDEWREFVDYAQANELSLEDIYFLKNRDKREQNIAKAASAEVQNQMRKAQQKPPSMASAGNVAGDNASPDDTLFDAIMGIDKQLDNAFG